MAEVRIDWVKVMQRHLTKRGKPLPNGANCIICGDRNVLLFLDESHDGVVHGVECRGCGLRWNEMRWTIGGDAPHVRRERDASGAPSR